MKRFTSIIVVICLLFGITPSRGNAVANDTRITRTVSVGSIYNDIFDDSTCYTDYQYDRDGHLLKVLSFGYANGMRTKYIEVDYEYDQNGVLRTKHTRFYQPPGGEYEEHYDRFGHLMEGTTFMTLLWSYGLWGENITCQYNKNGDLVQAEADGATWNYTYDYDGRAALVSGSTASEDISFIYHNNGNYTLMQGKKNTEGKYVEQEFSSDGKIIHYFEQYTENGNTRVDTDLVYTYDREGNQTRMYGIWWGDMPQIWQENEYEYLYRFDGKVKLSKQYDVKNNDRVLKVTTDYYYNDEDFSGKPLIPISSAITGYAFYGQITDYTKKYFYEATASSELQEGDLRFIADFAVNLNLYYPWAEGVKGEGINESITLRFKNTETILLLGFQLGYAANNSLFEINNRPSRLRIEFSDGSGFEYSFADTREEQVVQLSRAVTTDYVRLTILDVYPGTICDDTCIYMVRAFA